ncbi:MAG: LPS export ABC transporter permease LptF [Nitrospirae bacterium]|nr:LPS export ABC transporter permease LptF [Nitrospirota bacterium]
MIIRKYIFKELLMNFLMSAAFLSIVLFMEKFVRLSRLILGKGVDFTDIIKVFLFLQPSILLLSLPMAILIAVFLTYGRMTTDSEVIILKSSGMSFWSISRPAIMLSLAGFLILSSISIYLLPKSIHAFKITVYETIAKKVALTVEAETFSTVFKGTVIFVKEMLPKDKFKDIFIYREGDTKEPMVIVAENGSISSNPEQGTINLNMHNGVIHTFGSKSSSEVSFSEYDFVLTSTTQPGGEMKPGEMGIVELWNNRKQSVSLMIEFNRRIAIPFACLIFGFLGPALSTRIGRTGRLGAFSFSMGVLIFYYFLMILGEGLVKSNKIDAFAGGWIPNILLGAVSAWFFYMACMDKPFFRKSGLSRNKLLTS